MLVQEAIEVLKRMRPNDEVHLSFGNNMRTRPRNNSDVDGDGDYVGMSLTYHQARSIACTIK
jgi:hypothetical protein